MDNLSDENFVQEMLRIKDMLQTVENDLLRLGLDEIKISTMQGLFIWSTNEPADRAAV
jgi:hypothetical protein